VSGLEINFDSATDIPGGGTDSGAVMMGRHFEILVLMIVSLLLL